MSQSFRAAEEEARARHDEIRANVERVRELARRTSAGEGSAAMALADAMTALALQVRRSVADERSSLRPHLDRMRGAEQRKDRLERDLQAEIEAIWNVDYYGSHLAMAADAEDIASGVLAALRDEDQLLASSREES
ncbi:MAG: hypothetical protein JNL21_41330 [Myxococcales bacterium]|nr:hypothetical protein [Myxococcales bacterium]